MQLRYILLCIGLREEWDANRRLKSKSEFEEEVSSRFSRNCYHVDNYLSKAIRKYHFQTDGSFKMLFVMPTLLDDSFINVSECAKAQVHVSESEIEAYRQMTGLEQRCEYYLGLLERGYELISRYKEIPMEALRECHDKFRQGGYKNEWLFKKLRVKEYGLRFELNCYFTMFDFRLVLSAYDLKDGSLLAEDVVLQTYPNEDAFDYKFKFVEVHGSDIVIYDFLHWEAFRIDIPSLREGRVDVRYLEYPKLEEMDRDRIARCTW